MLDVALRFSVGRVPDHQVELSASSSRPVLEEVLLDDPSRRVAELRPNLDVDRSQVDPRHLFDHRPDEGTNASARLEHPEDRILGRQRRDPIHHGCSDKRRREVGVERHPSVTGRRNGSGLSESPFQRVEVNRRQLRELAGEHLDRARKRERRSDVRALELCPFPVTPDPIEG